MRRFRPAAALALLTGGLVAGGLSGCASNNAAALRGDLLRTQDVLARTQIELREARAELAAAERSADALRARLDVGGPVVAEAPEQTRAMGRITQLTVSRLLTGGLDHDGEPGDETLAVVLAPADAGGDPVKVAGSVSLELLDLSAPRDRRQVGQWSFDAAEAAEKWRSTALGTGYRFRLPLAPRPPGATGGEELHLVARFEAADGRQFDLTHPLHVNRRRSIGAAEPPPAPVPFPEDVPPATLPAAAPAPTGAPPDDPFASPPATLEPVPPEPFPVTSPPAEESADATPPGIAEAPVDPFGPGNDPFAEL
ncbi:hypothetical protein [Alienimonas californiensis]|uniref:Lipoprotein n=1 Tax=Alienimonas californiensis TaxID=2527989 RepID=A0A517P8U8_9PLAN|nr:hypothetical protein [Alienimonas californiensis]QDT15782.1 hypothetical protein CA12_18760 [Alienimonas californiensis]